MRLGLVIYGNLDRLSGGYLYDRMLVTHLRAQGDSVEIIPLPWHNYLFQLKDNFSSKLFRRLADLQVDLLLQDELNHPSLFMLNHRLREQINYPIVSIVHHLRINEAFPEWQSRIYRIIERHYLFSVDGFIFNSLTTCQEVDNLLRETRARRPPSLVAYPGGDHLNPMICEAEIMRRMQQNKTLQLLFVGNIIPRKGLDVLLRALKEISGDLWKLTVVGSLYADSSYIQAVRRQISENGLARTVHFAGVLDDHELANCMKASHLLVVPSSYDGFGIVYLEGMGFGLPAIGTTGGAAKEIITHGLDGFLIPPGDAFALPRYLVKLARNRQRLLEMSLAALQSYRSHPTWEESLKDVRKFLAEIVDKRTANMVTEKRNYIL
jgi:glycosyltransferase involved in cell wall biosynthesis